MVIYIKYYIIDSIKYNDMIPKYISINIDYNDNNIPIEIIDRLVIEH